VAMSRVLGFVLVVVPPVVYILLGACGFWE
jgi:hypothetical protein